MAHSRNTPHLIESRCRLPYALADMVQKGRREGCHKKGPAPKLRSHHGNRYSRTHLMNDTGGFLQLGRPIVPLPDVLRKS